MSKQDYIFSIAGITIRLRSDMEWQITEAFAPFQTEEDKTEACSYTAEFQEVSVLELPKEPPIFDDGRFFVGATKEDPCTRYFREDGLDQKIYAQSSCNFEDRFVKIRYLASAAEKFCDIQKAFLHIAWERILIREQKLMLHASYVDTAWGGLLFSGPSGIGKSTQSNLWCRFGEGTLLNGDKTILSREEQWLGYGSPYAGSSGCYESKSREVRAVFFLKQGSSCSLRRLELSEGFKRLYTSLTINHWEKAYVEQASETAYRFAMEIPMYEFVCTPEEAAVHFLWMKLQEGV